MEKNENIEITRILDILKSKKLVILFILVVFIVLGYVYSYHYVVPKYKATSSLLLIPNSSSENTVVRNTDLAVNTDLTVNSGLIDTYCKIGENSKVIKQVINNLGLDMTEEELLKEMKIKVIKDTYVIQVEVTNIEAQKAMEIANEFDKVFLEEIQKIYHLNNIGIVDDAQLPEEAYNINHIKDMFLFFALGIGVAIISIVIFFLFDNTIQKEEEIEKYIHLKSLGSIPMNQDKTQEIVSRTNAKSYVTECVNTIRTNILYMNATKNAKTILITSCTPREGKSWVSANIATAFAETDKKVLLIDADMRKGRAHKIFKVKNTEGLSNYLYAITGEMEKDIKLGKKYIKETEIPKLHILTNGTIPPNPSELLESNDMKQLLNLLKNMYDVIIIDAPPCKLVTDSIILSTIADSTVLVANAEKTKMNDFKEVRKSIQMVGGEIIGAILNKKKMGGKTYSKSYYYGHTKSKEIEEVKEKETISVEQIVKQAIKKWKEEGFEDTFHEEGKVIEDKNVENVSKEEMKEKNFYQEIKKFINEKMKELQQEKLTKKQMESIIQQEMVNLNKNKLTKEQVKTIVNENKLTKEQVETIVNENKLTKEQVKKIVNENKLTKEQVENIIKEEIANVNYTQDIEQIYNQLEQAKLSTSEMIKNSNEEILNTIKNEKNTEETVQLLLNERINQIKEETQELLQQEIIKINYTEQIAQINEILNKLKDNYLELSNKIENSKVDTTIIEQENSVIEKNNKNNRNIIDFKAFMKQKNKKKNVYSIEEDIAYEDLEQTATYVVPLEVKKVSNGLAL